MFPWDDRGDGHPSDTTLLNTLAPVLVAHGLLTHAEILKVCESKYHLDQNDYDETPIRGACFDSGFGHPSRHLSSLHASAGHCVRALETAVAPGRSEGHEGVGKTTMTKRPFAVPALILALAILAGTSVLYTPLPDTVSEPWKLQLLLGGLKVMRALTQVVTFIGPYSHIENMDWMLESALLHNYESSAAGDVKLTHTEMAGVPVVIYRPVGADPSSAPATIFFHGGGFVLLTARQGAGGGARTIERTVPADFRMRSLSTVPPTPHARESCTIPINTHNKNESE
ncbi:neutral cholesterol ester hydrolase 1-like [Plakobranchus ocellatus]|uniref:Neutral cholesterol ester hydrolase 1-like n=1 Tax=Plakobranchus ocellatus TaxID=259542 RepID=A0AAV4BCU7_9GAST|nr:neutral cholesterol ester hydrolase 1-like [Plakobranchus ocellatus]